MSFRGFTLQPKKPYRHGMPDENTLFVRQVALSAQAKEGSHATLSVKFDDKSLVACRLRFGSADQATVDLPINSSDIELVVEGNCPVDVIGHEEEEFDSEEESMFDDDDEAALAQLEMNGMLGAEGDDESEDEAPALVDINDLDPSPRQTGAKKNAKKGAAASPKQAPKASPKQSPKASPKQSPKASPKQNKQAANDTETVEEMMARIAEAPSSGDEEMGSEGPSDDEEAGVLESEFKKKRPNQQNKQNPAKKHKNQQGQATAVAKPQAEGKKNNKKKNNATNGAATTPEKKGKKGGNKAFATPPKPAQNKKNAAHKDTPMPKGKGKKKN